MATKFSSWSKCLKRCGGTEKKPKSRSALLACARKCLRAKGRKPRRKARRGRAKPLRSKLPRACSTDPKAICPKTFCRVTKAGRVCVYKRTKPKPRRRK